MKSLKPYVVAHGDNISELEESVADYLRQGYVLQGTIVAGVYSQGIGSLHQTRPTLYQVLTPPVPTLPSHPGFTPFNPMPQMEWPHEQPAQSPTCTQHLPGKNRDER